ncbi:MAG: hypothetical protein N2319_07095 [Candidatus Kapabacteria bacterium]|nr:hypothetical protein [Candidatus Kapabacteria bacterium]
MVFFVLPSHDLPIAWIACRYDLFMTLFILLSIYFYLKILFIEKNNNFFYYFFLALFTFLSIFSKEHSFFLISLGLLMFLSEPKKIKLHLITTILIASYIAIYFLLRAFLIGGSPFNSSNFANINFLDLISNFFLYLITSLIHPELFLEFIQNKELNFIFITLIFIILIITFHLVFLIFKFKPSYSCFIIATSDKPKKLCLFGLLFYFFSVIPVLPIYMRWYSFFPFIGIIILLAAIIFEIDSKIENLTLKESLSKNKLKLYTLNLFYLFVAFYILISLIFNYDNAKKWNLASDEVTKVLNSLKYIETSSSDTLTLWGIPDKIEGINAMKLGVEQAVHYSINKENVNVKAPLRIECDKDYSLSFNIINDSIFTFTLKGGILKHQFTDRFDIDSIFVENDEYILKILNNPNYKEKSGFAELFFKKRSKSTIDIAWTGKNFKKF